MILLRSVQLMLVVLKYNRMLAYDHLYSQYDIMLYVINRRKTHNYRFNQRLCYVKRSFFETYLWDVLPLWRAVQVTECGRIDRPSLLVSVHPCPAPSDWLPASGVGGQSLHDWGLLLHGVLSPPCQDLHIHMCMWCNLHMVEKYSISGVSY